MALISAPVAVIGAPIVAARAYSFYGVAGSAAPLPSLKGIGEFHLYPRGFGAGTVRGTTTELGAPNTPLRSRVRLIREKDGRVIRECMSSAMTGAYRFDSVGVSDTYTVVAYHPTRDKRAVIADGLVPEAIALP